MEATVLKDPSHPARQAAPPGPYVLFINQAAKGADRTRRAVHTVHMLSVPDLAVRRAALSELQRAIDSGAPWMSQHARTLVPQYAERLVSPRTDEWVLAGAGLSNALERDFALNGAGLHQTLEMNVEKGDDQCWPGVVWPSAASLLLGREDGFALLLTPEAAVEAVNRCADEAASLPEALDHYEKLFGHLPLAEPFSLGPVVGRWRQRREKAESDWESLLQWADAGDCLRWYHVCRAATGRENLIPPGQHRRFWQRLAQTLRAMASPNDPEWRLRARLAAHYFRHLQVAAPPVTPDRLACSALWAAAQTSRAMLGGSPGGVRQRRAASFQNMSEKLAEESELFWRWAPPPAGPSVVGYLVSLGLSPWALTLLGELGDACDRLRPEEAAPEDLGMIAGLLKRCLALGLGAAPPVESEVPWGFRLSLAGTAKQIAPRLNDADRPVMEEAIGLYSAVAGLDGMAELLRSLPKTDGPRQVWICHLLYLLCSTTTLLADTIWELLSDAGWRNACLAELPDEPLGALFAAITQVQLREGQKWSAWVPHVWANAALSREAPPERRRRFLALALMSASAGQNTSALARLREDVGPGSLDSEVRNWRSRLADLAAAAPPWTAARLRDLASQLAR